MSTSTRHDTVVIGAGQAGLSAAYHLARRERDFVVLDASDRLGDQWRSRYDSLRLYSPAKYDSLPGKPFPLPAHAFPTGNQMADYLESYAEHFGLPVRTGMTVDSLRAADGAGDGYVVTSGGETFESANVVIAAGFFRQPYVPPFAADLDPRIRQIHSADYRRPDQLAAGPVLVVGLSHSGADLAMEVIPEHPTILSGKGHGQLPFSVDSRTGRVAWPFLRFLALNLLTVHTPVGRRMRPEIRSNGGAPLLRYRRSDLLRAGVELVEARTVGVENGKPKLADGRILDVANVVWCTGFRPDFSWIELPIFGDDGFPVEERGVVGSAPGIYFVGLPFQSGFSSMLVLGAGRDAGYVVERLAARRSGEATAARRTAESSKVT